MREVIERIATDRPTYASRVFELVRRVFSWAMEKDVLATSPCMGLKKPSPERRRDLVLSDPELRAIWAAASDAHPKVAKRIQERSRTSGWVWHDTRRTVRTRLAEMGVAPHVAEAVLGHVAPGIVRTCNLHEPVPEMRAALSLVGRQASCWACRASTSSATRRDSASRTST